MTEPATILVTRPLEDAAALVHRLQEFGYHPLVEPMLTIRPIPGVQVDLTDCQAILFTSANGVRALAAVDPSRDIQVVAVGAASAEEARKAGYAHVMESGGNLGKLVETVWHEFNPEHGPMFHAAGSVTAGDLKGSLEKYGFSLRREALYEAHPVTALSKACRAAFELGEIDAVTFFSPRTARSFVKLLELEGCSHCARTATALCLSPAVADAARTLNWADIQTAKRPDTESLLSCLNTLFNDVD